MKNIEITQNNFVYFGKGKISLYTASIFFNEIIREAWYQYISERYIATRFDEDDYFRQALNFSIYSFKIQVKEEADKRNNIKK